MTIYWADSVRNAVLDAIEAAFGPTPIVRIYDATGGVPATEATALGSQVKLAEVTLASDWAENAGATTAGEKNFLNLPIAMTGLSPGGDAAFYRVYKADGTTCVEQGTVGVSDADMIIDNVTIVTGRTVNITAWKKVAPH